MDVLAHYIHSLRDIQLTSGVRQQRRCFCAQYKYTPGLVQAATTERWPQKAEKTFESQLS